ncbi:MAG TPA: 3-phosphoshikimate 1-carboxyvinyltransferase, partial [Acholeplasmataceae bacterium]|nr:3-phosphoshikimate 1-carboxyvinyltransferase [Acholeplasmataceae bacterium]
MIKIIPTPLEGSVDIVSSKSLSHRYVLAAALAEGKSKIENILDSDDLVATKNALIGLGAKIKDDVIIGSKVKKVADTIDCFESGSTVRFLIPVAMLQEEPVTFIGKNQLPFRTQAMYEEIFKDNYQFDHPKDRWLPLTVSGPLKGGTYPLRGDVSSQFITGLLYALPLAPNDSEIVLTSHLESVGYVDLTLDVLKKFGIKIIPTPTGYKIPGNQVYQPGNYKVEGDFSGAAFFVAAGLLSGPITLNNLNHESLQGDKAIIDIAQQMGGKIKKTEDGYKVYPSKLKGVTVDVGQIPDLGPILMVLGALAEGTMIIENAARLRIKESDRLEAMVSNLTKIGAQIKVDGDRVEITGQKTLKGGKEVSSFKDHRIAMAMA